MLEGPDTMLFFVVVESDFSGTREQNTRALIASGE